MQADSFEMPSDAQAIFVRRWRPEGAAKGVVQIAHGLAEHSGRYDRLAQALNRAGYAVYASDHRGHGQTAPTAADLGHFADRDGFAAVVADLWRLNRRIADEHPGLPMVLLGHSMGSFMVQDVIGRHGDALAGAVLSGSSGKPGTLAKLGALIARTERLRLGRRGRSKLLMGLSFGGFNKAFEPARTPFDWLSRDPAEVDKYIADKLCGFVCSPQLWIDLLAALNRIGRSEHLAQVPKNLPLYLVSGALDPVGGAGAGVRRLAAAYQAAGLRRVEVTLYPEGRHEPFNDSNRAQVTADLLDWLRRVTG